MTPINIKLPASNYTELIICSCQISQPLGFIILCLLISLYDSIIFFLFINSTKFHLLLFSYSKCDECAQRCIATGYPLASVQWLKDGQPLRTGSRVRLLTKEHIKITSVTKEDRGMYQCFVRNDYDAVQSTAEMRLGGKFVFR